MSLYVFTPLYYNYVYVESSTINEGYCSIRWKQLDSEIANAHMGHYI